MALRLMEIIIPKENVAETHQLLEAAPIQGIWEESDAESKVLFKVLLPVEKTENVMDILEQRFSHTEGFSLVLLPVEASLPRPEKEEKPAIETKKPEKKSGILPLRVSREEVYADVQESSEVNSTFIAMVILSAIVAAIGLLQSNTAVIIGAMVIAPLLGPNVALALATTLGDYTLGKNAIKVNLTGFAIALIFSVLLGSVMTVDPTTPEILARTVVSQMDIILAIASGCAGALAFTTAASGTLIGVMVAVALLPPLVTFGILLGAAQFELAFSAFLLLMINLICVNLAGVLTFLLQGIRPRQWWEAQKARRLTRYAIGIWTTLLVLLAFIIYLSSQPR